MARNWFHLPPSLSISILHLEYDCDPFWQELEKIHYLQCLSKGKGWIINPSPIYKVQLSLSTFVAK